MLTDSEVDWRVPHSVPNPLDHTSIPDVLNLISRYSAESNSVIGLVVARNTDLTAWRTVI